MLEAEEEAEDIPANKTMRSRKILLLRSMMTPETLLSFMCTSVWWVSAVSFFGAASLFGGRRDHISLRAIFSQTCFSMLPHYTRLFY